MTSDTGKSAVVIERITRRLKHGATMTVEARDSDNLSDYIKVGDPITGEQWRKLTKVYIQEQARRVSEGSTLGASTALRSLAYSKGYDISREPVKLRQHLSPFGTWMELGGDTEWTYTAERDAWWPHDCSDDEWPCRCEHPKQRFETQAEMVEWLLDEPDDQRDWMPAWMAEDVPDGPVTPS